MGSASRPGRSLLPGKTWYPLYRRLVGPHGRFGQVRKTSPPPGFNPRTFQPVASRYIYWATRPTTWLKMYFISYESRFRHMRVCHNIHAVLHNLLHRKFFFNIKENQVLIPHTEKLPSGLFSFLLCVWCSTVSSASARNSQFLDYTKYSFIRGSCMAHYMGLLKLPLLK